MAVVVRRCERYVTEVSGAEKRVVVRLLVTVLP